MRVFLIRHAQVEANLKGVDFNDEKNSNLTPEGKRQAEKLAKRLIKFKIDKIFVSESKRTYQTILPLIELKPIPVEINPGLNEANFGIFSGLTFKEAKEKYPKIYEKRLKDKWNFKIPKGESFKGVDERLKSFFNDLKKETKKNQIKNFLIVTHATVLKVFLIYYLKYSIEKADLIHFRNTSISFFNFKKGKFKPIKINDFSHLEKP